MLTSALLGDGDMYPAAVELAAVVGERLLHRRLGLEGDERNALAETRRGVAHEHRLPHDLAALAEEI